MSETKYDSKRQADELYEQYGRPLEAQHYGEFVAIAPDGRTIVAPTVDQVMDEAIETFGPGSFIFKLGEKIVWHWR